MGKKVTSLKISEDTPVKDLTLIDEKTYEKIHAVICETMDKIDDFDEADMFYFLGVIGGVMLFSPFDADENKYKLGQYFLTGYYNSLSAIAITKMKKEKS